MKAKKKRRRPPCSDGHPEKEVILRRVRNILTGKTARQFVCLRCRQTLTLTDEENLIGNPFGILERTDEVRTAKLFAELRREW
jgi:hypothetical protein